MKLDKTIVLGFSNLLYNIFTLFPHYGRGNAMFPVAWCQAVWRS